MVDFGQTQQKFVERVALVGTLILVCSGCSKETVNPAPPRVDTAAPIPAHTSTITVPMAVQLNDLKQALNAEVPKQLWAIDKPDQTCLAPTRVKVFGARIPVTPKIKCRIVGQVTRGPITLSGSGQVLRIRMPVNATVSARDIGGIIKRETATGSAVVTAVARLSMGNDWTPRARIRLDYDWRQEPGIKFLGQRIRFTEQADKKLQPTLAKLEQNLPSELAKLHAREVIADVWQQGFTTIMLNRERPPAWLRVTPKQLGFGGYEISDGEMQLMLSAEAITETFVGNEPDKPAPAQLPPPHFDPGNHGLRFFIPVLADYDQLVPVLQRTLAKLAQKPIVLDAIGPVDVTFGKVQVYATERERLAVGIETSVVARDHRWSKTNGIVWLTGLPYNEPGSQKIFIRDLGLATSTDSRAADLLIELYRNPDLITEIERGLTHDFAPDFDRVMAAARKAIAERRQGSVLLSAEVTRVVNGKLAVTGQGLFMPVEVQGEAMLRLIPR